MVVTPKEAIKLNAQKDQQQLASLEELIDRELLERYRGQPLSIGIQYPSGKVYDALERRYQAAGWKIKLESDQRDGSYLVFTEAGQ